MKLLNTTLAAAGIGMALCSIGFSQQEGLKGNASKMPIDGKTVKKDHILMDDGKLLVMKDGKVVPMDRDMALENGTKVMLDGTLVMSDGNTLKLGEDDMIFMDGKLVKRDRLVLKDGVVMTVRDGKTIPLEKDVTFENGTTVMLDGRVITKDGKITKMDETDMVMMNGKMKKIPQMPVGPKSKN